MISFITAHEVNHWDFSGGPVFAEINSISVLLCLSFLSGKIIPTQLLFHSYQKNSQSPQGQHCSWNLKNEPFCLFVIWRKNIKCSALYSEIISILFQAGRHRLATICLSLSLAVTLPWWACSSRGFPSQYSLLRSAQSYSSPQRSESNRCTRGLLLRVSGPLLLLVSFSGEYLCG